MKANLVKTSLDKPLIEHSGVSVESLSTEYSKPSYGDAPAPHSAGCISVLSSRSRGALAKGDGTSEERSSLTGAFCPDSSPGSAEATGKRKEHPKFTGSRFKAVAHVVLAMKRFQGGPGFTLAALTMLHDTWVLHIFWLLFASLMHLQF